MTSINTNANTAIEKEIYLLRKQADMMEMALLYGVDGWRKLVMVRDAEPPMTEWRGFNQLAIATTLGCWQEHKFALAVIEGKPMFDGDEYYEPNGAKLIASEDSYLLKDIGFSKDCTLSPPKLATITVRGPH